MKDALKSVCSLVLLCLSIGAARGDGVVWLTDLAKAQAAANGEKKCVLLYFHGSDWCPPCIAMQRELFDSPDFSAFARQSLILVDVDFPQKAQMSDEQKQVNLALKTKFNVGESLPTIVLLNAAGETAFQEAGYVEQGAPAVLANLRRHTGQGSDNAARGYRNVDVAEFAALAGDKENVILDVRTPEEFQAGHLSGALNIDVNAADFGARVEGLDKSKTYLVHCASGGRSAKACQKLSLIDFPHLYNLSGGYRAWVTAGEPVVKN